MHDLRQSATMHECGGGVGEVAAACGHQPTELHGHHLFPADCSTVLK